MIPCAVLALYIHPRTHHHIVNRICWAFCVYLESISVLPQLRVMQNTKVWLRITCAPTNFLLNQCPNKGYYWVVSFNVYMIFTRLFLLIFLSFFSYYFRLLNPSRHIMYLRLELPGSWVVHIGSSRFDSAAYRFWDITWLCYWKIVWPLYYELFVLVIHLGITNYHQTFVAVAHSPSTRQRTFIQSNVLSTRLISTLI